MTPAAQTPPPRAHAVDGVATIPHRGLRPDGDSATSLRQAARAVPRAAIRLCLGWTFLWPFMDKTFGLGHETASADAWLSGG